MKWLLGFGAGCLLAAGANAAVVYSQTPIIDGGSGSDPDYPGITATGFSLTDSATVRSVTWRGFYLGPEPPTDSFSVNVYAVSGGLPGVLLESFVIGNALGGRTDTGTTWHTTPIYEYVADLGAGIALTAGDVYWISIFNDTTAYADVNWAWGMKMPPLDPPVPLSAISDDGGTNWTSTYGSRLMYMSLDSANVPIPASVWLLGSGLGLLGWFRRRKTA